jgi:hypothetical protein
MIMMPMPMNAVSNNVSPAFTQPPNGQSFSSQCDDSMERKKLKDCLKNALSTLKNIMAKCKKVLGDDAPECCINTSCIDSLKNGSNSSNKKCSPGTENIKELLEIFQNGLKSMDSKKHTKKKHRHKKHSKGKNHKNDCLEGSCESKKKNSSNSDECRDPCD